MMKKEKKKIMPKYDYHCNDCNGNFQIVMSLEEYKKVHINCQNCESPSVIRFFKGGIANIINDEKPQKKEKVGTVVHRTIKETRELVEEMKKNKISKED